MCKRISIVLLAFLLCFPITAQAGQAQQKEVEYPDLNNTVGFALPTYGWIHYNQAGRIKSLTGFNAGLGYSWRGYFGKGVKLNQFNGYWGWGTVVLIVPYLELGTTYALPIGEANQILAIDVGLIYIFPNLGFSIWF